MVRERRPNFEIIGGGISPDHLPGWAAVLEESGFTPAEINKVLNPIILKKMSEAANAEGRLGWERVVRESLDFNEEDE
jgi:hypothetical protein